MDDQDSRETRLNELYSDCGCGAGMIAVGSVTVAYVTWMVLVGEPINWLNGVRGLLLVIAAAIVGKMIGLAKNRVSLLVLLARLERAASGPAERRSD